MTFQVFHDLYKPSNCEQITYQREVAFFSMINLFWKYTCM